MAEAKPQTGGEDPSMEEILQSIKKIIAEDEPAKQSAEPVKANGTHQEVAGSDVLELTEALPEEAPAPVPAAKETPAAVPNNDVLSKIDEALAVTPPPVASPATQTGTNTMLSDQATHAATSAIKKLQDAAEPPLPPLSTTPSPMLASGKTVENMVMDMIRPMLKDWLDKNLPGIVERIVTIETRKLTK